MLGSAERIRKVRLGVKLFSNNSNACDHIYQRYRQTDGQTDRQTTYHGNTALRHASRGKNDVGVI